MKDFLKKAMERVWLEGDPDRDHSVGLTVFGTLEIVTGIMAFVFAMLLLILVSTTGLGGMKTSHFDIALGFLFYMTGWFCTMGVGSIMARRWARALMLVGSWVAVFFGTVLLALILYLLPWMYNLLADSGIVSSQAALVVLYLAVPVLIVLELVFPLVSVVFYNLKGVQSTCERRNPESCWTDRCPLPLVALGFISGIGASSVLLGVTVNYAVFLFGHILVGFPGFLVVALLAAACGYVGRGAFKRDYKAWWAAYALILVTSASMMLSFSELEMEEIYSRMGYSIEQIAELQKLQFISPVVLTFVTCTWGFVACIYLVWVRDCFLPEKDPVEVKSYQQRMAEQAVPAAPSPRRPRMRLED